MFLLALAMSVAHAELKPAAPLEGSALATGSLLAAGSAQRTQPSDCEPPTARSGGIDAAAAQGKSKHSPRVDDVLVSQARGGDAQAAWRVALVLFRGDCSALNYGQVLSFVQIAAQAGHACGIGAMGLMLARGWGIERDLPEARELLERSAKAGCRRAYYWSWLADELAARPQLRARALVQLTQGADAGDGHALNALAVVREIDGQRGDARQLYSRAASAGNATARTNLARLARYFSQSSEKPSVALLSRLAEGGDALAQFQLARRLHQGDGVPTDYVKALKWYKRAADKKNPAAREMLALIQARLGSGELPEKVLSSLAMVDLTNDELNKQRGVTQPIEDTDPFAGS